MHFDGHKSCRVDYYLKYKQTREQYFAFIFLCNLLFAFSGSDKEYPPYNGWYNNRGNPSWGAFGKILFLAFSLIVSRKCF